MKLVGGLILGEGGNHLMFTAWKAGAVPFLTSFHKGEEVLSLNTLYSGLP